MNKKKQIVRFSASMKLYIKLVGFPLVFVLLWVCPTLYRILEPILKRPMFPLYFLLTVTRYSHGFCNTWVLILSDIVGRWSDSIRKKSNKVNIYQEQELYDLPDDGTVAKEKYDRWLSEGDVLDDGEETSSNFEIKDE
jgi:hypothetical protein